MGAKGCWVERKGKLLSGSSVPGRLGAARVLPTFPLLKHPSESGSILILRTRKRRLEQVKLHTAGEFWLQLEDKDA